MNFMIGDGIRANTKRAVAFKRKPHDNRKRSWIIIINEHKKEEEEKCSNSHWIMNIITN